MIKNIIFDWTGVVEDSLEIAYSTHMGVLKVLGVADISLQDFREKWEEPYMNYYKKVVPGITKERQNKVYAMVVEDIKQPKARPEAKEVLSRLKQNGAKMFVVSGELKKFLLPRVEEFGFSDVFSEVKYDTHDKLETVRNILDEYNLKPEETAFVGDSFQEIDVSKKLGMKSVAVSWGLQSEARLRTKNPDYVIHSFEDLEKIILDK